MDRLNFRYEELLKLGEAFKAALEGRMSWGDTLFLTLGEGDSKCLVIWTPKNTSERDYLPGFYTDDGAFQMKMKYKPGAWVTYADLNDIRHSIASKSEEYGEPTEERDRKMAEQEVIFSVRELERNTKNLVDFADGVVTNFIVMHRGKPIKLLDLLRREEELHMEIRFIRFKSGAYILFTEPGKVIIPEKTISSGVHLNSDELVSELSNGKDVNAFCVLYSSYIRETPDFYDVQQYFHLTEQLEEVPVVEGQSSLSQNVKALLGVAVFDPLVYNSVKLNLFSIDCDSERFEGLVNDSADFMNKCFAEMNKKIAEISNAHQGRIRNRINLLNQSQNIINSIVFETPQTPFSGEAGSFQGLQTAGNDSPTLERGERRSGASDQNESVQRIVSNETETVLADFMDFSLQLFQKEFEEDTAEKIIQNLKDYHKRILELKEERGYISSNELNNFINKSTFSIHDAIIMSRFIKSGVMTPHPLKVFEDNIEIDRINFPATASWEIKEMFEVQSLSNVQRQRHEELLSKIPEIENFAGRQGYGAREVLSPLCDILLSVNSAGELEVDAETFAETIERIQKNSSEIRECISHAPSAGEDYYAKLSALISQGEVKESVCKRIGYFEGLTLTTPEQVHELLLLIKRNKLIELERKEQRLFLKALESELSERTGKQLSQIVNDEKWVQIYADDILDSIKIALSACLKTLDESAEGLIELMRLDDKQLANRLKKRRPRGKGTKNKGRAALLPMNAVDDERKRINVSLERIVDAKAEIRKLSQRLESHPDVLPKLFEKLRSQPDLPLVPWVVEEPPEPEVVEIIPTPEEVIEVPPEEVEVAPEEIPAPEEEMPVEAEVAEEEISEEVEAMPEEEISAEVEEEEEAPPEEELVEEYPPVKEIPTEDVETAPEEKVPVVEVVAEEEEPEEEVMPVEAEEEVEEEVPAEAVVQDEVPPTVEVLPEEEIEIESPPVAEVVEEALPPDELKVEEEKPSVTEPDETETVQYEEMPREEIVPPVAEELPPEEVVVEEKPAVEEPEEVEVDIAPPEEIVPEEEPVLETAEEVPPMEAEVPTPPVAEEVVEVEIEVQETIPPVVEEEVEEAPPTEVEEAVEEEPEVIPPEEVEPVEEILPEEELPSIEELLEEFPLLGREEITESLESGLSGSELRDYLAIRAETIAEEMPVPEPTPEDWLNRINIDQYPNLNAFIRGKGLRLTTTGRQLIGLRRISDDALREGQLLTAEIVELRTNEYSEEVISPLMVYLAHELDNWKSNDVTAQDMPRLARHVVLCRHVCYERELSDFLELTMEYEEIVEDSSKLDEERKAEYEKMEGEYNALLETL